MCGRSADPERDGNPPLRWCADIVTDLDGSHTRWVCEECTRRYVRSIEAKLDAEYW
jgi:hypothetical protein